MAVQGYDAKKVLITFAGIPLKGLAPDSFLEVEHNNDIFTLIVGADGEATRSRTNDNSGLFTVTLLASSKTNQFLSALLLLDAGSAGAGGTGPMLIKDLSGNSIAVAETAWIKKFPMMGFAREAGERVWVFETDNIQVFVGGNSDIGGTVDPQEPVNLSSI